MFAAGFWVLFIFVCLFVFFFPLVIILPQLTFIVNISNEICSDTVLRQLNKTQSFR